MPVNPFVLWMAIGLALLAGSLLIVAAILSESEKKVERLEAENREQEERLRAWLPQSDHASILDVLEDGLKTPPGPRKNYRDH